MSRIFRTAQVVLPEAADTLFVEAFSDARAQTKAQQIHPAAFVNRPRLPYFLQAYQFVGQGADKTQRPFVAGKLHQPGDVDKQFFHRLPVVCGQNPAYMPLDKGNGVGIQYVVVDNLGSLRFAPQLKSQLPEVIADL